MNVVTTINMSNYIASDVPLSPISSDWETSSNLDLSTLNYSYPVASPLPVSKMLRGRMSPDNSDSEPQLCLPTSQVFDMSYAPTPEAMSSPPSETEQLPPTPPSRHASVVPSKRPSTSGTSVSKKARGSAVSTKDYVPPDVSGLSKREARLVKNRAAAFLSRQRKREEFETMELRVAELEQENARLMALAQKKQEPPEEELLSEVEQLRAQLAAAEARERELSEQLTRKSEEPAKEVTPEPELTLAPRVAPSQSLHKSGASLGLMVLLCALPTLLTLPTHSNVPTTFSLPLSNTNSVQASSTFDMNSFMPGDFDWMTSGAGSMMDFDMDGLDMLSRPRMDSSKKLEFVDEDSEALGLSGLDISFDATPSEDGKIRVKIHPPASSSAPVSSAPSPEASSDGDDQSMFGGSDFGGAPSPAASDFLSDDKLGPFLGVGSDFPSMAIDSSSDLSSPTSTSFSSSGLSEPFDFNFGDLASGFSVSTSTGRRRVRIALKSMPGQGREGGEWEVQLC
ncbi:hypothetical protein BC629DRAFT_427875 [Irpex lacteus]|nr:hypothetical protein BC629DRAFT_427875 [Irpex lacteus]